MKNMLLITCTDFRHGEFTFNAENILHMQPTTEAQWDNMRDETRHGEPRTTIFLNVGADNGSFLVTESVEELNTRIRLAQERNAALLADRLDRVFDRFENLYNQHRTLTLKEELTTI